MFLSIDFTGRMSNNQSINIYLSLALYDQLQLAERLCLVVYCRLTDANSEFEVSIQASVSERTRQARSKKVGSGLQERDWDHHPTSQPRYTV